MTDLFLLLCKEHGLPLPEKEFRFHHPRRWRIDYCFVEQKLAVEIEGGTWVFGRHNYPTGYHKDREKYNQLTMNGYWLLRFTPKEAENGYAVDVIKTWFKEKEKT